ncbi:hypothetical protein NIIDNTM18_34670 [Mycolicibacterium litorale]|uniref:Uncharacterized protein n=1 Tax=Mycolicibacterium litorale TaxID=758802 RepID=A0A6S6P716_9MYCO|nr:hypothetical protein NIIDNTM18_34670 [Mycolicibacterium litorale]
MISGLLVDTASPSAALGEAAILRHEGVDLSRSEVVERCGQKDQLRVLALQRQEPAEQRFGSGADDQIDVLDLEGGGDVTAFALGTPVRLAQFVGRVLCRQDVDPELVTAHGVLEVLGGLDVFGW